MAKRSAAHSALSVSGQENVFAPRKPDDAARISKPEVHIFGNGFVCDTDTRGHSRPNGRTLAELVVDASEGFVPLWAKDVTLRWRFQERSLNFFQDPAGAKAAIRKLLGEAILAWGDAAPVKFSQRSDAWDFEIVVRDGDRCSVDGCVLASAFFPDAGRHELRIYPKMFSLSREEQVETIVHELGHVFGLRHFFANISEKDWPAQIFGVHSAFSIMNYGNKSMLTADDRKDLKTLYQAVWSGQLDKINGTPVRLVKPFSASGSA